MTYADKRDRRAGCSTFLKMIGNKRYGYEKVEGDVTYGGTSAEKMGKDFRGEILYNPEDDFRMLFRVDDMLMELG